ncbi:MAG: LTA synthase family protein [Gudongella sp.]|nr:LTA synthase family protein [Gudongella sp.]
MKKNKTYLNFKNNIMLILLVLGGIFNDFSLRVLTIGDVFKLKPIISSISIILIISVLALFLNYKNRNYVYILLSAVFGLLSAGNYLYYKHFNSFLSFSLLKQFNQLSEMEGTLAKTLDIKIIIFMVPTLVLIVIFKKLKKLEFFQKIESTKHKKEVIRPFILGTVTMIIVFLTLSSTDVSRLVKQWNRPYLVDQLGIYSYATADIVKTTIANNESKTKEVDKDKFKIKLESLVEKNINSIERNDYTDIFKGKDVYVIHYESGQTFPMDLEFSDGKVTPFLNKMSQEGIYFDNFYPQHSIGTSSDSEFTFSTSLLPLNNGTVFMTHADREFTTIQKLLKNQGYYTFAMHGNNGDFWNRNMMYGNLGYEKFFNKQDYIIDEEIGLGLSDKSFFRQSIEKIKLIKEEKNMPIMATLITLSNHFPFDDLENYGDFTVDYLEGTPIGNYLKSYHYADMALESFVNGMDEQGLLDNAIIVLYGDHHAKISSEEYEMIYNYNSEIDGYLSKDDLDYKTIDKAYLKQIRKTPLIIWSKDESIATKVEKPIGMIDVFPTLSNMLGVFNPFQIGKDIFSVEKNLVTFPNGDFVDENYFYSASNSKLYDLETNELIEDEEIIEKALKIQLDSDEEIELSSNIIESNLIDYFNELLKTDQIRKSLSIRLQ